MELNFEITVKGGAAMSISIYQNPILPGFHPDPSICRVGEDYYLVNSTFSYFPGVPIFHSKDLIHWTQIGNILDREEQLNLSETEHSGGIFAPTIRYYQGTYYMITTNVTHGGNFIVTAQKPTGPWSNPYFLEDADGIDPSLFFDDDGRCYYCGTKGRREGGAFWGDNEIYIQELDLKTMKLIGPSYAAWHGALRDGEWQEGPHIYKKDGFYYLMIAEGGTGLNHAVTIARSKSLTAPFEGCKRNPILTHRHLGKNYPIVNTGHADLVETSTGEWFMVLLASRPCDGFCNLGRETFLVPVTWEDGWPVVNYGIGLVEEKSFDDSVKRHSIVEHFETDELPPYFLYLRNPIKENYSLKDNPSHLRLYSSPIRLVDKNSPTAVFIRQTNFCYSLEAKLLLSPFADSVETGIVLMQSNEFHYRFFITPIKENEKNQLSLQLIECKNGIETIIAKENILTLNNPNSGERTNQDYIYLKVLSQRQQLSFSYSFNETEYHYLTQNIDASILSTERAGGFVGTCLGVYIGDVHKEDGKTEFRSFDSQKEDNYVDFDWISYESF